MKKVLAIIVFLLVVPVVAAGFFFTKKVGKIKTDTEGVTLQLEGMWWSKITVGPEVNAIEAKKGTYRPRRLYRELERKVSGGAGSEKSERWQISSSGPWGKLKKVAVKEDETTELKFGGPLTVKPTVTIPSRFVGRVTVTVGLKVVGEYGEEYGVRATMTDENGRKRSGKEPKVKIFDESGKELANGKFAFG